VALEKVEGVSVALVDEGITLLVDNDKPLDEAAVKAAVEPLKMKLGEIQKAEHLPF
jgi:hypothetical protein